MKKWVNSVKLFGVLFFFGYFQCTKLIGMEVTAMEVEESSGHISAEIIELVEGILTGEGTGYTRFDYMHKAGKEEQEASAHGLLPDFFVPHMQIIDLDCAPAASICWSCDGKKILSGRSDGVLRTFNLEKQTLVDHKEHTDSVDAVAYSPNGRYVASASKDKAVIVWDMENKVRTKFKGHDGGVTAVCWSPDSTMFASGSEDRSIYIWDIETRVCTVFMGHDDKVVSLAWSKDGKSIISGSSDGTKREWDVLTGDSRVISQYQDWMSCVGFSPDGKWMAGMVNSDDGSLGIYDVGRWPEIGTPKIFTKNTALTTPLVWSPDGTMIAYGAADKTVMIWRKVTDLDQALLILVLQYLQENDRIDEFFKMMSARYFNVEYWYFLLDSWQKFNDFERSYLEKIYLGTTVD